MIEYDGATYYGAGPLRQAPETTGRTMPAVRPSCDDSGGQDDQDVRDEPVQVQELAAVDADVAVIAHDGIYVRDGEDLPDVVRSWFHAPRCTTPGAFEVTADWLGVTGPHQAERDGDIELPYRLEVRVTDGPERYVGATVTLRAGTGTDPALSSEDVKQSLWEGGQVTATVRCVEGRYDVVGVRAVH
ncbi:hypothetical protein GCM10023349_38690 [Nocardioides conyzicola]|uniref:Uncharacterized protein n=2 Tax=Nocardioides conyzicola TaxID=1651781 RepID=A0ABP8XUH4_9ACTN